MHTEADVIEDYNTWGLPAAQLMRAHATATWDGPLRRRFWVPRDAPFANLQAYLRGEYHESALVIGAEPLDLDMLAHETASFIANKCRHSPFHTNSTNSLKK